MIARRCLCLLGFGRLHGPDFFPAALLPDLLRRRFDEAAFGFLFLNGGFRQSLFPCNFALNTGQIGQAFSHHPFAELCLCLFDCGQGTAVDALHKGSQLFGSNPFDTSGQAVNVSGIIENAKVPLVSPDDLIAVFPEARDKLSSVCAFAEDAGDFRFNVSRIESAFEAAKHLP